MTPYPGYHACPALVNAQEPLPPTSDQARTLENRGVTFGEAWAALLSAPEPQVARPLPGCRITAGPTSD